MRLSSLLLARNLDLIVFGATGFSGRLIVEEIASRAGFDGLKWAAAARDELKLRNLMKEVEQKVGKDLSSVPLLAADVNDRNSLELMASEAETVLNAVGPFRFSGEPVIRACVKAGTNHLDISGEPNFLEHIQLKYDDVAKKSGVYVIGSCGFDSVPADMGLLFVQENCEGDAELIEHYTQIEPGSKGFHVHAATFTSAIEGIAHTDELKSTRRKLFPRRKSTVASELLDKSRDAAETYSSHSTRSFFLNLLRAGLIERNFSLGTWDIRLPAADKSVMQRTQRYLHKLDPMKYPTAEIYSYISFPSLWPAMKTVTAGVSVMAFARFEKARNFMLEHPNWFTLGVFSKAEPSKEEMDDCKIKETLVARSWREEFPGRVWLEDVRIVEVIIPDSGYLTTARCAVECARVLHGERSALPQGGGVYTPGAAFKDTTLRQKLKNCGIQFNVIKGLKGY